MRVFFYGLFMDEAFLAQRGIPTSDAAIGSVSNFELQIGERATLVRKLNSSSFGVVMTISPDHLEALYSGDSVSDYVAELTTVTLSDGQTEDAICYNLPPRQLTGTNRDYAKKLYNLAKRLGLPATHLAHIREFI